MKTPVIGLLPEIDTVVSSELVLTRTYVNMDYVEAVQRAGGNPVILPFVSDGRLLEQTMRSLDGLLVTGGRDVDPRHYHEAPTPELGPVRAERDEHDLRAIRLASSLQLPVFGICRGVQVLNVAFGGTLHQDIERCVPSAILHRHQTAGTVGVHDVRFVRGSRMEGVFGAVARTNSYHHAAVRDVAPGFVATGSTCDGVVEAIEAEGDVLVLGVQWHPELMAGVSDGQLELFRMLVSAAGGTP